jgi:hypothetical protein
MMPGNPKRSIDDQDREDTEKVRYREREIQGNRDTGEERSRQREI